MKRYSSGMYVRLAFAVAAHLEPEILVIDEVLAVGDAEFQKKCLGKMDDVSQRDGRTVLFVSHNMEAVLKLCKSALLLDGGKLAAKGNTTDVLDVYLAGHISRSGTIDLRTMSRPSFCLAKSRVAEISSGNQNGNWIFPFGDPITLEICVETQIPVDDIELAIGLFSARGFEVTSWTNRCSRTAVPLRPGSNLLRVEYSDMLLLPGHYSFGIGLRSERGIEDYLSNAANFEIVASAMSAEISTQGFGGVLVPRAKIFSFDENKSANSLHVAG